MRYFLIICLFLFGCKEPEEIEPCISGPTQVEPLSTHTYTYCGEGSPIIFWSHYSQEGFGKEFEVTFPRTPGNYEIQQTILGNSTSVHSKGTEFEVNSQYEGEVPVHVIVHRVPDNHDVRYSSSGFGQVATVSLYQSKECAQNDTVNKTSPCLVATMETDEYGVAKFDNLESGETYYVIATSDNYYSSFYTDELFWDITDPILTDWSKYRPDGNIAVYDELSPFKVYIGPSPLVYLASAEHWVYKDYRIDGKSDWDNIDACEKDDYLKFFMSKNWVQSHGSNNCRNGEEDLIYQLHDIPGLDDYSGELTDFEVHHVFGKRSFVDVSAGTLTIEEYDEVFDIRYEYVYRRVE